MSRIATLTLAFNSELEHARRAYDDFAAYVEGRTLKIPVEWQQPSSGAPGSPTAPPGGAPPSAPQATFGGLVVPFPVAPATPPPAPVRATPTANPLADATGPVITRTLTDAFAAAAVESARQFARAPESYASARLPFQPPPPREVPRQFANLSGVPEFARDEIERRYATGARRGVVEDIERLSAQRKTSNEVAAEIAGRMGEAKPSEVREVVRGVRAKLGIPSMEERIEFEDWRNRYNARQRPRIEPTPVTPISTAAAQATPAATPAQPATRLLPAPPTPVITPTPPQAQSAAPPLPPPPPPVQPTTAAPPPPPGPQPQVQPIPVTARRVPPPVSPAQPPPPVQPPSPAQPTGSPGQPPAPPTGPFGLREGMLRRYATTGFLLAEASRLGAAFVERDEAIALSAGNFRAQLQAEQRFQQSITSVPFVGRGAEFLADSIAARRGYGPIGTALAAQGADIQDQRARTRAEDFAARRGLQRNVDLAYARLSGDFEARRTETRVAREQTVEAAQDRRQQAADEDTAIIANLRAAARDRYVNAPDKGALLRAAGVTLSDRELFLEAPAVADRYADAAVQSERTQRAQRRDQRLQQATETAGGLERLRREQIGRDETNAAFNIAAGGVTARLQGQNNPVLAGLNQLLTENSNAAFNAPANLRPGVLTANTERFRAFFDTLRRETKNITDDVQSTTREVEQAGAGNTLGADFERIRREEQKALRAIPRVGSLFGVNLDETLGLNAQRDAIRAEADAQRHLAEQDEQRRQVLVQGEIESGGLRLRRQPLQAALTQARSQTQAQLTGVAPFIPSGLPGLPGVNVPNPNYFATAQLGQIAEEQIRQQNADQQRLTAAALAGRQDELNALQRRDTAGAQAARIAATGTQERLGFEQSGQFGFAVTAGLQTAEQLQLFKRDYLESFRGTEVSPLNFDPLNARDSENPASVIANIDEKIADAFKAVIPDFMQNLQSILGGLIGG